MILIGFIPSADCYMGILENSDYYKPSAEVIKEAKNGIGTLMKDVYI